VELASVAGTLPTAEQLPLGEEFADRSLSTRLSLLLVLLQEAKVTTKDATYIITQLAKYMFHKQILQDLMMFLGSLLDPE
jgi:hypothetical protein